MITIEIIEKRKEQLEAERTELIGRIQAYNGAIQDCEYWIEQTKEEQ